MANSAYIQFQLLLPSFLDSDEVDCSISGSDCHNPLKHMFKKLLPCFPKVHACIPVRFNAYMSILLISTIIVCKVFKYECVQLDKWNIILNLC